MQCEVQLQIYNMVGGGWPGGGRDEKTAESYYTGNEREKKKEKKTSLGWRRDLLWSGGEGQITDCSEWSRKRE